MKRRDFTKLTGGLLLAASLPSSFARAAEGEFEATSGETVYFRGWQFATDIVQGNVDRYNELYRGHVDYGTITGDYPALMEQSLISKVPLDIIWMDRERRVVEVSADTPPCLKEAAECPSYGGTAESYYVLEVAGGQAAALQLKLGDKLRF